MALLGGPAERMDARPATERPRSLPPANEKLNFAKVVLLEEIRRLWCCREVLLRGLVFSLPQESAQYYQILQNPLDG